MVVGGIEWPAGRQEITMKVMMITETWHDNILPPSVVFTTGDVHMAHIPPHTFLRGEPKHILGLMATMGSRPCRADWWPQTSERRCLIGFVLVCVGRSPCACPVCTDERVVVYFLHVPTSREEFYQARSHSGLLSQHSQRAVSKGRRTHLTSHVFGSQHFLQGENNLVVDQLRSDSDYHLNCWLTKWILGADSYNQIS